MSWCFRWLSVYLGWEGRVSALLEEAIFLPPTKYSRFRLYGLRIYGLFSLFSLIWSYLLVNFSEIWSFLLLHIGHFGYMVHFWLVRTWTIYPESTVLYVYGPDDGGMAGWGRDT